MSTSQGYKLLKKVNQEQQKPFIQQQILASIEMKKKLASSDKILQDTSGVVDLMVSCLEMMGKSFFVAMAEVLPMHSTLQPNYQDASEKIALPYLLKHYMSIPLS